MRIYLALPVQNEYENLPALFKCLASQSFKNFSLFVCVNQPDDWWGRGDKLQICTRNADSLRYLDQTFGFPVKVINKATPGEGWKGKHYGVGWARKVVMDAINEEATDIDLMVSIDADTFYPPAYLQSVINRFVAKRPFLALSNPYYHNLTGCAGNDRAILRYEIYMRNYWINMKRINNPYCFTALGSAISVPVWVYRKVNGITPKKSGEDFYFLQKIAKSGRISNYNTVKVFPSSRESSRVFFGTGPAVSKGVLGVWDSYPIYHYSLFDRVKGLFDLFPELFGRDIPTVFDDFISMVFPGEQVWKMLRANSSGTEAFVRLCVQKIDGLRILQFLKHSQPELAISDEQSLVENVRVVFNEEIYNIINQGEFSFKNSGIENWPRSGISWLKRRMLCERRVNDNYTGANSNR